MTDQTADRAEGYYWVVIGRHSPQWAVAEWNGEKWCTDWLIKPQRSDSVFGRIGPRIEPPQEPPR